MKRINGNRSSTLRWMMAAPLVVVQLFSTPGQVSGAAFKGDARVEVADSTGSLSWDTTTQQMTVSCWFKLVIPTGISVTNDMVILVNSRAGTTASNHAYLFRWNSNNGNVEFSARGSSGPVVATMIENPFLDRWYHLAVTRSGDGFFGYVDGRRVFGVTRAIGDSRNADGISIGGWKTDQYLRGEVQEVRVFNTELTHSAIVSTMFRDLSDEPPENLRSLKGYYKLGFSEDPADHYKNFAIEPPDDTSPGAKQGSGAVAFEETNQKGEQSLFDSRKNDGRDAISPLSGAFTWGQTIFTRPTPGIPFVLEVGYSSSNAFNKISLNQSAGSDPNPLEDSVLGSGWRHSFELRAIPGQRFSPTNRSSTIGIMEWNGNIETWDKDPATGAYSTRHEEYRGELLRVDPAGQDRLEWTTPDRIVYVFSSPFGFDDSQEELQGRLLEIRDFSGNRISLEYEQNDLASSYGKITKITDTGGGEYRFSYGATRKLEKVEFGLPGSAWAASFEYFPDGLLKKFEVSAPAVSPQLVSDPPLATDWEFKYNDLTPKLLSEITDPRGNPALKIAYDSRGRVTTQTDAASRVRKNEYHTPKLRQTTLTDERTEKWISTYDRKGRLVESRDPLGNTARQEYDDFGNVIRTVDALGNEARFKYDARSNLTESVNALAEKTTTEYHSFFNSPVAVTDPSGWTTHFVYDWDGATGTGTGNLLHQYDAIGDLVTYTYTPRGLPETSTDGNGNLTSFTYTSEGFLATQTQPGDHTANFFYNEWGWAIRSDNPLGEQAKSFYNINGHVVKTVDALQREITSEYDANGNVIKQTDARGNSTSFTYDAVNQRTAMTTADGQTWNFEYLKTGQLHKSIAPQVSGETSRHEVVNEYDAAGRLVKAIDPRGNFTTTGYDGNGNVVKRADKEGKEWLRRYDALNRVIATENPIGDMTRTTYDINGRIETVTTPKGNVTRNEYDGRGRLVMWQDAEGYEWRYLYDGKENILKITDARGGEYLMEYGSRDELVKEVNQDGLIWNYTYDELRRLKTESDPNGRTKSLGYDSGGRIEAVGWDTGRTDVFAYDSNDNLLSLTRTGSGDPGTSLLTYDVMNRVTSYRDPFSKLVGYGYDELGRRKTLIYPGGKTLRYGYDELGRLTKQTDWLGNETTYAYDKVGSLTQRNYPNGVIQTNAYDEAGRLTSLDCAKENDESPTLLLAYRYAYDRNGNVLGSEEEGTYDWPLPERIDENADYTASGRLISRRNAEAANGSLDFDYAYDPAGNLLSAVSPARSYSFTYDEDNRTTSISCDVGLTEKCVVNRYDSFGRRISRVLDRVETRFVLDLTGTMERTLCDTNRSGVVTAYYVNGKGLSYKIDPEDGNSLTFYHHDASGNVVALSDAGGTIKERYAYTAYGRSLGEADGESFNKYRYVGSQGVLEELPNLYFMRARYYSAEAGKFLSRDPVRNVGPHFGAMAYAYGNANPLSFADPTGLLYFEIEGRGEMSGGAGDGAARSEGWYLGWEVNFDSSGISFAQFSGFREREGDLAIGGGSSVGATLGVYTSNPEDWAEHTEVSAYAHVKGGGSVNGHYGPEWNQFGFAFGPGAGLGIGVSITDSEVSTGGKDWDSRDAKPSMLTDRFFSPLFDKAGIERSGGSAPQNSYARGQAAPSFAPAATVASVSNRGNSTHSVKLYGRTFKIDDKQEEHYVARATGGSRSSARGIISRNGRVKSIRTSRGGGITVITHEKRSRASIRERDRRYRDSRSRRGRR